MSGLTLETYGLSDAQYSIQDAHQFRWGSAYGPEGGGFTTLAFRLPRKFGYSYPDIDEGHRVILRKTVSDVLFAGHIRAITEASDASGDAIDVAALGDIALLDDDEVLRTFCDKRYTMWRARSEIDTGSLTPSKYSISSNAIGLYIHPNNNAYMYPGDYTKAEYEFYPGESARRIKCDLTTVLGMGVIFDAEISAVDEVNGYVDYTNASGEANVDEWHILHNMTQDKEATVASIDTGIDRITVKDAANIAGWAATDEIYCPGPMFGAKIQGISGAVITYKDDGGEGNLQNGARLANVNKKAAATIQSYNTGANTITVTDEDHIADWDDDETIFMVWAGMWYAQVVSLNNDGDGTGKVVYKSDTGTPVVSAEDENGNPTIGWYIYNETRDDYATVDGWTVASDQVHCDAWADISSWALNDDIWIYTPFQIEIYDDTDAKIWPTATDDVRLGARLHDRTSINLTAAGSPTGLYIKARTYIEGYYTESTFAQFENLRVYSITDTSTVEPLAEYIISLLSASNRGLSSSTFLATIGSPRTLEPMIFEFTTPREAMSWACRFGDDNGDELAWGISLTEAAKLYVELMDNETFSYLIAPRAGGSISWSTDIQESWQQVRGLYQNKRGEQQYTDWIADATAYLRGVMYRRKSIRLESVDNATDADYLTQAFLDENKYPKIASRITVENGMVFNALGVPIPVDELKATGKLVLINDQRAVQGRDPDNSDIRNKWVIQRIVGVEIDYDNGSAEIVPANPGISFENLLARAVEMGRLR